MTDHRVGVNGVVQIDPNDVLGIERDEGVVTGLSVLLWPGRWRIALREGSGGGGGSGGTITADDTPAAPAEGSSASYLVTSAVTWPAGLVWSTDPDGGVAPTITGTALVSMFTVDGVTRAVMGATFPAPVVPDTTAPDAGTLAVAPSSTSALGTVTGASDTEALDAAPYSFRLDTGAWSAWQASASYTWTGLTASTAYTFQHRVIDAAGNTTEGTAVTDTTDAPPVAGTYAWERQAAMVSSNSSLSLHLPVAGTPGRLLVACMAFDKDTGAVSVSSGWNLVAAAGTGGQSPTAMAWRIATGLDDITLSTATSRGTNLSVHEYSGFSGVPDITYAVADSGETAVTSITCDAGAASGGGVAVAIAGLDSVNVPDVATVTSDYTMRQRTKNLVTGGGSNLLAVADKVVQLGDPSSVTFGFGNSDQSSAIVAVFKG